MLLREALERRLRDAGYSERGGGVYFATITGRAIAMIDAAPEPAQWANKLDIMLRLEVLRHVPAWSRYILLIVSSQKTIQLGTAAAAFCREVSKCRRLVAFTSQSAEEVLPFLGLSSTVSESRSIASDPEEITARIFGHGSNVTRAFLDLSTSIPEVQRLAENSGEK
jgi:hypothetical protein